MFISPTDAVKMYDVSKPTLYKDMQDGKLSFTIDDRDRRKINVAELDRLYAKRQDIAGDLTSINGNHNDSFTEPNVNHQHLFQQMKSIREQIGQAKDREIELLEQQIEQFKDQVENLHRHLEETREEHRIYVRLLEDKRADQGVKTSQWDQKLNMMEYELNAVKEQNRLLLTQQEERKARDEERKKRIEERKHQKEAEKLRELEKNKGFFSKLLG